MYSDQLIAHDRVDEARCILWALDGNSNTIDESNPAVECEMAEIQHALQEEKEAAIGSNMFTMFRNGPQKFLHRTLLGIGGQFMQQLCGINLITYVSWIHKHRYIKP